MENNNSECVLFKLISYLDIAVTRQSISEELQKHPDYGSMLALSEVLDNFRISNSAYQVPFDQLAEVSLPFVAYLSDKTYALVTQFDDQRAVLSNEKWKEKIFTVHEFGKLYRGSVLVAGKTANSGEPGYVKKRKKEVLRKLSRRTGAIGTAVLLLWVLVVDSPIVEAITLQFGILVLLKFAGFITSTVLLIQSIDANNPLIQKLCGNDNDKNCNAILSSDAAKIKGISWSEIGFFYFTGTLFALVFNSRNTPVWQLLALCNLLGLPYTFYSVYYQLRVVKQWCVFCVTVQTILWLEFLTFLPSLIPGISLPGVAGWGNLIACLLAPIFVWMVIRPYVLQLVKVEPLAGQLRKFKYNKELFDAALKVQPHYATPAGEWSIVLGNTAAPNIVTMASNPYCQPCAKVHAQLEEVLGTMDNIQVRLVFVGNNNDEKDARTRIHRHLMSLNEQEDASLVSSALHSWYAQKQKNYETWAKSYPAVVQISEKLDKQREWVKMAEIKATPALLLNGYRLPRTYQLQDLKYMLD